MKQARNKLAIFEGKKIRRHWDEEQEKWYFSVVEYSGYPDKSAGLSVSQKLLESIEKSFKSRRK